MISVKRAGEHIPEDVDFQQALETELNSVLNCKLRIRNLYRSPFPYRTSYPIEYLKVYFHEGTELDVIFKNLSWHSLTETTQKAKPEFLYNPLREINVYKKLLSLNKSDTAIYYGSIVESSLDRYWLFLEKIPGIELYQVGDLSFWQQVARWIARFHVSYYGLMEQIGCEVNLLMHDAHYYQRWITRAKNFVYQDKLTAMRLRMEWLAERYDKAVDYLISLPRTFIHGEFYPSNILIQTLENELRICPIDWEMASIGPGLMDLAALIAGNWNEMDKALITDAYQRELSSHIMVHEKEFNTALMCCQLAVAVQWLGWSPHWTPPPEHSQDWLKQACNLAEGLRL
jgi:hypothetical protein